MLAFKEGTVKHFRCKTNKAPCFGTCWNHGGNWSFGGSRWTSVLMFHFVLRILRPLHNLTQMIVEFHLLLGCLKLFVFFPWHFFHVTIFSLGCFCNGKVPWCFLFWNFKKCRWTRDQIQGYQIYVFLKNPF